MKIRLPYLNAAMYKLFFSLRRSRREGIMKLKTDHIVKYRLPVILGLFLITVFVGLRIRDMTIEPDLEELIPTDMSSRINTDKIEEIFGATDMVFIAFETDDVLAEPTLRRIKKLSKKLKRIKGINDILSLFDTKKIVGENGVMIVEPAVGKIPKTDRAREALRSDLKGNELAYEIVVSKDFRLATILLMLDNNADEETVLQEVDSLISRYPGKEKVHLAGQPVFRRQIAEDILTDLSLLIPAALGIMLIVLFIFFRQRRGVLLPFLIVSMSVVFGLGLYPLFGWKFTLITAILPVMVVAIANNYAIHIVARYQELSGKPGNHTGPGLAKSVLIQLAKPVLVTGLTTIVGILGLLMHVLVPAKQMSVAAAIAIAFALILSLLLVPAILSMLKVPVQHTNMHKPDRSILKLILSATSRTIIRNPVMVLTAAGIITLLGALAALRVKVDTNQEKLFSPAHPVAASSRLINENFGGTQNVSVLVEGDIKDPELLRSMEEFQTEIEKLPGVGLTNSMADVLRVMSKALNDSSETGFDRIPETRNAVAQYLEFYSMSGDPEDFERLVDFNYEKAQINIMVNDGTTEIVENIVNKARQLADKNTAFTLVGGYAMIMAEFARSITNGQIASLVFAVAAITILLMLLFRSFAAGLIAIIPLVSSVVLCFGVMGVFNINLDMATALITSIVIGAGVDFTIHFLWRYRDERAAGHSYAEALMNTMITTGRSIVFNALSVVAGFSALFLSSMPPLRSFALLFSVSILTCMAGALTAIPALCLVFKPRFLEPVISNQDSNKT